MKMLVFVAALLCACCLPARGALMYLSIPSVNGQDPTPGFPNAMAINSITIAPNFFSMTKLVDQASTQLAADVVSGTPLSTAKALFYNSTPLGAPDESLSLRNVVATAVNNMGGTPAREKDSFSSTSPAFIYLQVPGIAGVSSTPGFSNLMQVQSVTINANDISIVKAVDAASLPIATDVVEGTPFSSASLLFYNSTPVGAPDAILSFKGLVGSSYTSLSRGANPTEQDTFDFTSLSTSTPEPAGAAVTGIIATTLMLRRKSR